MPSAPTIRVQIPMKSSLSSVKMLFEKNENKLKEAGIGPFRNEGKATSATNYTEFVAHSVGRMSGHLRSAVRSPFIEHLLRHFLLLIDRK